MVFGTVEHVILFKKASAPSPLISIRPKPFTITSMRGKMFYLITDHIFGRGIAIRRDMFEIRWFKEGRTLPTIDHAKFSAHALAQDRARLFWPICQQGALHGHVVMKFILIIFDRFQSKCGISVLAYSKAARVKEPAFHSVWPSTTHSAKSFAGWLPFHRMPPRAGS